MSYIDDRGALNFEDQNEFNEWLLTRIIVLESLLADRFGLTRQNFDTLHAQGQAYKDQRRAESSMTGD